MVAEGVRATRMFVKIAPKLNIEIPFLISLTQLLDGEIPVEEAVRSMVASYQD
jgi:glycerol-3-phosphate dehydrogenase